MLKKKALCLIVFLVCVSFISANLMIRPTQVKQNDHIQVTIYNLDRYDAYLHFYTQGFENVLHSINLGCGETCFGKRTFDYLIDSSIFELGFYDIAVFSHDDNMWLFYGFEVVAGEITCTDSDNGKDYYIKGTVYGTDGLNPVGNWSDCCIDSIYDFGCRTYSTNFVAERFCNDENLVRVEAYECPIGYVCDDGACIEEGIVCDDGTLVGQCSTTKPKYCDNSGNLIDDCQMCGCPENYDCQEDRGCAVIIKEGFNWYQVSEEYYGNIFDSDGSLYGKPTHTCEEFCVDLDLEAKPKCIGWYDNPDYCRKTVNNEGDISSATKVCNETPPSQSKIGLRYCCCGQESITCTDSDITEEYPDGKNYYVKGTCIDSGGINPESCATGSGGSVSLVEYYCNIENRCDVVAITCPYGCENGACIAIPSIPIAPNTKLTSLYSDKEVFLVSDKDWKNVLPFVSVAVWTDGSAINKYPFLIYHEESSDYFDVDSIIYFIQQYNPSRVTIIGSTPQDLDNLLIASLDLGAGLSLEQIQRINVNDYLSYWESFDTLVYVEDNYELALLASTYASLIDAPLIIQGTTQDSADIFTERNIVCVGNVTPAGSSCSEEYTLEQLQQKYKTETNTDKIILVNPTDWITLVSWGMSTDSSFIYNLYTKTSLIAPILASAKHELILSTTETNYQNIDSFLEPKLSGTNYLTIIAAPNVIPYRKQMDDLGGYPNYRALDQTQYADLNGDMFPDISVGRIMGISSSDVSSYIARDLFYNTFSKTNNMKFMASSFSYMIHQATTMATQFTNIGYNADLVISEEECHQFDPIEWKNQDLISYQDHGASSWAGIGSYSIPSLSNSIIFNDACSTCSDYEGWSFCNRAIRQGALAHFGAVCIAWTGSSFYLNTMDGIYSSGLDIGKSFKGAFDAYKNSDERLNYKCRYMTTLFGDPTLQLNPPYLGECENTKTSCGRFPNCEDCTTKPPVHLFCSGFGNLRGFYFGRCKESECVENALSRRVEVCEYGCSEQREAHCMTAEEAARCEGTDTSCGYDPRDDYADSETGCTNCQDKPPVVFECNIWKTKIKGWKYECDNRICDTKGIFPVVIEECDHSCKEVDGDPICTCNSDGEGCLTNINCCDGLHCSLFKCKDCKEKTKSCLTNTDCCSDLHCVLFACKDCKQKTQTCWTDTDCCTELGLQCSFFTCKDCYLAGTKVNLFTQDSCCNGWEWVTKTVHRWPACKLGKGSGCRRWTHDSGYKIVNDYKICK